MLYAICKPIVVVIMKLLFRLEAHGTEHVPATGPFLIVANHSSFLDPPLVGGMTPRRLTFLAKAELFRVPVFGALIRRLGSQPLRRDGGDVAALLAMQTGVPVVPAYVRGSGRAWPRGQRLPRPAKVVVTFGPPLSFARPTGADRKAQYEAASRRMMAAIAELKDEAVRGAGVAGARRPLQIH